MPTYEYECTACGQHIEVFQRIAEDPLTTCGVCGGPLRKVFHPAGIVFKGSGFYATDSRKAAASSSKRDGDRSGSKAADGGSGSEGGSSAGSSGGASGGSSGASSSGDTAGSSSATAKESSSS